MKRTLIPIACAALAAVSCTQNLSDEGAKDMQSCADEGAISVSLDLGKAMTRAASEHVAMQDYEKQINTIDILVFDNGGASLAENPNKGVTHAYLRVGRSELTASAGNTYKINPQIKSIAGEKLVVAVVNCPDDLQHVANLDELKAWQIQLDDNSLSADEGFVMIGQTTAKVSPSNGTANPVAVSITASRLAARVALVRVTNNLPSSYGELVIDRMFLSNVVGDYTLGGGAADPVRWYNPLGRATEDPVVKEHVIDGVTYFAAAPKLTFDDAALTVANGSTADKTGVLAAPRFFYAFPNSTETDPATWPDTFEGAKTRLILSAEIKTDGEKATRFYYPVVIPSLAANSTYDVSVTISGFGVTGPQEVIEKGAIEASVTVNDWIPGEAIDADL